MRRIFRPFKLRRWTNGEHIMNIRLLTITTAIIAAALARLAPHPPNVTPIGAMAVFGGACFASRKMAYVVPLLAMLISDVVLGCTRYGLLSLLAIQPVVYACIGAAAAIGQYVRDRRKVWQVGTATLAGSVLFFLVTNFATWAAGQLYPLTLSGLADCYRAAIPFFRNSLVGDAAFAAILFGGLALAENRLPWMREDAGSVRV
jgi:hypothetical protein